MANPTQQRYPLICLTCSNSYFVIKSQVSWRKTCSKGCHGIRIGKMMLGRKHTDEAKKKMRGKNKGRIVSLETRKKASLALRGKVAWNKGLKGINAGEKNHFWRGGITTPERLLWFSRQRRIKKLGAEGSHTQEEFVLLKAMYDYMCLCCKRYEPEVTLSEDHIIPLSKGGTDYIENIQPLCRSCNSRKHTAITDYRNSYGISSS